jgi:ERF superfamily
MVSKMPTTVPAGTDLVQLIERFQNLDEVKLKAVLDAFKDMQDRQAKAEFNIAFAELLENLPPVLKDKNNPLFRSRYASHESIMDSLHPALKEYGIGARFGSSATGNPKVQQPFLVLFKGLYSETHSFDISVAPEGPKGGRPAMNDAQALGSGLTYARKYLLMNAFNLVLEEDDDDGNAAGARRPRSGLRDHHVAQRMSEAGQAEQHNGNGNGNGNGNRKPTLAEWLDGLQAECDAADTIDEAEQILKRPEVMNCDETLAKHPQALAAVQEMKQNLIRRIWQDTPRSHVP